MGVTSQEDVTSQRPGESPDAAITRIDAESERLTTQCGDGVMVWRVWGSGPPLVLLHGGYGSWRHWIRTIPFFASSHRLLVPDLPGLGDSDGLQGNVVPEDIATIVTTGLEQLIPIGQPYDLVGFSFGALISGHIAAQIGPVLRSLTLVGGGALGLSRGHVALLKWSPEMSVDELRAIHRTNLLRLMIADPTRLDDLALLIQEQNTKLARIKSRKLATSDSLAQALLKSAPQYLNAIWGGLDAIAGRHMDERKTFLHTIRPDSGFHVIPNAGHWVAYEAPDQFNKLLKQLLAGIARAD